MQFHCSSQHCRSSQCRCHRCHSELFVALAALFEPSLSYAVPSLRFALLFHAIAVLCHRCALLRQAVAERPIALPSLNCSQAAHCSSFAGLFFAVSFHAVPLPCASAPCPSLPLLRDSNPRGAFAPQINSLPRLRISLPLPGSPKLRYAFALRCCSSPFQSSRSPCIANLRFPLP